MMKTTMKQCHCKNHWKKILTDNHGGNNEIDLDIDRPTDTIGVDLEHKTVNESVTNTHVSEEGATNEPNRKRKLETI